MGVCCSDPPAPDGGNRKTVTDQYKPHGVIPAVRQANPHFSSRNRKPTLVVKSVESKEKKVKPLDRFRSH